MSQYYNIPSASIMLKSKGRGGERQAWICWGFFSSEISRENRTWVHEVWRKRLGFRNYPSI